VLAGAGAGSSLWVGSYADGSYWILKNMNWTWNQYPGGTGIWIKFSVWFLVVWYVLVPTTGAGFMENLKNQPPIRTGIWIQFSIWFPTFLCFVPTTGAGFMENLKNQPPIRTGIWIRFSIWFPTVPTTGTGFSRKLRTRPESKLLLEPESGSSSQSGSQISGLHVLDSEKFGISCWNYFRLQSSVCKFSFTRSISISR
jgi:hypothetical protein